MNGSTVTAKGAWQLTVAICPSLEDPKQQPPDTAAKTRSEAQANAKLIAAAPELLSALEGLLDQIENGRPFKGTPEDMQRESVSVARAAIAKATAR